MNNAIFGKTMENAKKYRDIKLVTTERRRNYVVSEANHHTTKIFTENLSATKMKKKTPQILMNKTTYLGLSADDIYKDVAEDVEQIFATSNYETDRSLPKGKNKKVIGLLKIN